MSSTPYVPRSEWGARPPRGGYSSISPAYLTAHYGGPSPWPRPGAFDHARCASIVRAWQAYHMDRNGWVDLAYSSVVCAHGFRFEGRGPGRRTAANGTNAGNGASLATCYLAGEGDPLTDAAREAFRDEADRFGVPLVKVHSDWYATACPGDPVRAWVRSGAPRPGGYTPPTIPTPAPPAALQEVPDMGFIIAEGVGIFAVVDGVIAGYPDLASYARDKDATPGAPVLRVSGDTAEALVSGLLKRQAAQSS